MIEIRAREICPECKGTGHVEGDKRFQSCLSCLRFGGHGFIELWIPLDDLKLSQELTAAIREVFIKKTT